MCKTGVVFINPAVIYEILMVDETSLGLPFCTKGLVVAGFGRGSKQLGIPTGNIIFIRTNIFYLDRSQFP